LWSVVIFTMSTDTFSPEHTKWFFEPVLRWFIPGLPQSQYEYMHHIIRKCAHFSEYFVYFVLLYRAVRGHDSGWRWVWGLSALFIAAGYSLLDEFHQAFVPSRGPSIYDSLLDSVGAFVALVVLRLWLRRRRVEAPDPPST